MNMQEEVSAKEEASANRPTPMVSAFLIKTYQLVDDASTNHIVSWGEDHTTFVVGSPLEMARLVLPRFFKHSNFTSFVRQLNLYGFRKVSSDKWEFANEFFRKGAKHLLCKIQTQKTEKTASSWPPSKNSTNDQHCNDISSFTPPSLTPMRSPVEEVLGSATLDISSEIDKLARGDHAKLLSELTRIRHLYEESLCIIQQQAKEGNGPQNCLPGSRASQCQHLQHQHSPFKDLDDSARKDGLGNNMGSSLLENRDMNMLSMSSIQDLQIGSRENRDEENRDNSGPSMNSAHAPRVCNDLTSLIPTSQSPMMEPKFFDVGREPLNLLNENNRLKRDNVILLSELTHVRKLYNEALSIIKIQRNQLEAGNHLQQHPSGLNTVNGKSGDMDGPFIDSSAAPSLNRIDIIQHKTDFTASPSYKHDAYHDAKKLRGCQDARGLVPQAATIDITTEKNSSNQSVNEEIKGPIRLFGVPLQCSKKRQHKELCDLNDIANTDTEDDELMIIKVVTKDRLFERIPSLKSSTVDSLDKLK